MAEVGQFSGVFPFVWKACGRAAAGSVVTRANPSGALQTQESAELCSLAVSQFAHFLCSIGGPLIKIVFDDGRF